MTEIWIFCPFFRQKINYYFGGSNMPRQSKDNDQKIYFVFPQDYRQLYSLLSVKDDSVELICKDFKVNPEYDLPYKLLSMIYSLDRYNRFEDLKGGCEKGNSLCFHRNGDGAWKDYLFQIPGIYELLGIKRGLDIDNDFAWNNISRVLFNSHNNGSLIDVFQTPILFLILVEQKISNDDSVSNATIELIKQAISSYKQNEERNSFDKEQVEFCKDFFLNTFRNNSIDAWRVGYDSKAFEETRIEVEKIVHDYIVNSNEKTEAFKHGSEKGATFSFPKYMRSIVLGIYERHDCLELILPMVKKNTLWTNTDEIVLKNIDEKTIRTFRMFQNYLYYRLEANELLDSCDLFMDDIGELWLIKNNACCVRIKENKERIDRLKAISVNHRIVPDKMKKIKKKFGR